jgi:F0F1-type ATP synthase epsilon subunit
MAANRKKFRLSVLGEQGVVYDGDCEVLFLPGKKESIAVLAHHTPMIMKLEAGQISMINDRSTTVLARVNSGLAYVAENKVSVLVNI